jgi:hypothetical protein
VLGKLAPQISTAELRKTGQEFPINYFPKPYNPNAFINLLKPYEEAVEDLFGTGINAIMHTLHAFCYLVMNSLPGPDDSDRFVFDQDPEDDDFAHRFSFMLGMGRKGFVRFPESYIRARLASIPVPPYSSSAEDARNLVDSFFSAFLLDRDQRSKIDVVRLQPLPLIYTSPGNSCYFDYLFLSDFLRWLIVRGREWYPTQHGDRFTLALKRFIKQQVADVDVLPQRREYRSPSGERAQIDLLVHSHNVLYVIECKAFSKSREFWLGKSEAISERLQNIRKAVLQAQRATSIMSEVLRAGDPDIPEVDHVEWVVCLPTQEYLKPIDKFGLLEADIPRVCTPEEFVKHLTTKY